MFDHKLYNKVRTKYNCNDALPVVYDKVSRDARKWRKQTEKVVTQYDEKKEEKKPQFFF